MKLQIRQRQISRREGVNLSFRFDQGAHNSVNYARHKLRKKETRV